MPFLSKMTACKMLIINNYMKDFGVIKWLIFNDTFLNFFAFSYTSSIALRNLLSL